MVLDRPKKSLHTNGSENDIRCQVTRRKVSTREHGHTASGGTAATLSSVSQNVRPTGHRDLGFLSGRRVRSWGTRSFTAGHYVRARLRPG